MSAGKRAPDLRVSGRVATIPVKRLYARATMIVANCAVYACIVPCYFDEAPPVDFDAEALPLFVSVDQAEGVATGPMR